MALRHFVGQLAIGHRTVIGYRCKGDLLGLIASLIRSVNDSIN